MDVAIKFEGEASERVSGRNRMDVYDVSLCFNGALTCKDGINVCTYVRDRSIIKVPQKESSLSLLSFPLWLFTETNVLETTAFVPPSPPSTSLLLLLSDRPSSPRTRSALHSRSLSSSLPLPQNPKFAYLAQAAETGRDGQEERSDFDCCPFVFKAAPKISEISDKFLSFLFSLHFAVEFEGLMIPNPSSSSSSTASSAESTAADSGVDSEVSPSSPDSTCYNGSNGNPSSSSNGDAASAQSIMETAETLLALKNSKSSNSNSSSNVSAAASVVFPQHPDPTAVLAVSKGKEGGLREYKEGGGGKKISSLSRNNLTFMAKGGRGTSPKVDEKR